MRARAGLSHFLEFYPQDLAWCLYGAGAQTTYPELTNLPLTTLNVIIAPASPQHLSTVH